MDKEQIQDLAVQYATEGLSVEQKVIYDAWVISASEDEKSIFSEMVDTCAEISVMGTDSVTFSDESKVQVFEKLESELGKDDPSVHMLRKDEQSWINLPIKGARLMELSARKKDGFVMSIIDVAPGTVFPEHDHHGVEMAYILEGDLEADGVMLEAGDFFRADAGTHHGTHFSPSGCRAMIVTANENYRHKTMATLNVMQKAYRKVKGVFAKVK